MVIVFAHVNHPHIEKVNVICSLLTMHVFLSSLHGELLKSMRIQLTLILNDSFLLKMSAYAYSYTDKQNEQ